MPEGLWFYCQKGVQIPSRTAAFDFREANRFEQACVSAHSALFTFGEYQHAKRLHVGFDGSDAVFMQEFFREEDCPARRKTRIDAAEEAVDFLFGPIVQDSAKGIDIARRQFVFEEIARRDFDPLASARLRDVFARDGDGAREIKHYAAHPRISLARRYREMSGGAA